MLRALTAVSLAVLALPACQAGVDVESDDQVEPEATRLEVGEYGRFLHLGYYVVEETETGATVGQFEADGRRIGTLIIEDGSVQQTWTDPSGTRWTMDWTTTEVTRDGELVTDFAPWQEMTLEQFSLDPVGRGVAAGQAVYEDLGLPDKVDMFAGTAKRRADEKMEAPIVCDEGNWLSCAGRASCLSGAPQGFCDYWCECQSWFGLVNNCRMTCCCGYAT
jgi:hypothetical protein